MQLATAEAIDRRVSLDITPNLPTTPVLVSQLVGGAQSPIEWQPVIASRQSSNKDGRATDSCPSLLDYSVKVITGCHSIGLCAPYLETNTGVRSW